MFTVFKGWIDRYLSDEEALIFLLILVSCFVIIICFGQVLAPVLTSLVLAYLLQGGMNLCKRYGLGHLASTLVMFSLFIGLFLATLLVVVPATVAQAGQLFYELPGMLLKGQDLLLLLPERYPEFISVEQVKHWSIKAADELASLGQWMVSFSLHSIPGLIGLLIYLVLVPILVFFFLKDGQLIIRWLLGFLPEERHLMRSIWLEMDEQIANYIRGKVLEIFIVAGVTYIGFAAFGLEYAELLAILVGLSVLVPYIGAAVVTLPVAPDRLFSVGVDGYFFLSDADLRHHTGARW